MDILWISLKYLPLIIFIWIPILLYYYFLNKLSYWKRHNVPYIAGLPFIGNYKSLITYEQSLFEHLREFYFHPKFRNEPIIGYFKFHKNALIMRDIELIKQILISDFQQFQNRSARVNMNTDELGAACILIARTPYWHTLRTRMSPCFSHNRIRKMFGLINSIGNELNRYLCDIQLNGKVMEFKEVAASYTTDIIARCAFGIKINCIQNPINEFRQAGRKFFECTIGRSIEFLCIEILPDLAEIFKFQFFPRESQSFFRQSIHHIMQERETNDIEQNDLIDTLIKLKNEDKKIVTTKSQIAFKGDVLVAQAAAFFIAGFETSSTLMSFTLFQLAWNENMQNRLRKEIKHHLKANNNDEELTIELVNQMEYLDMIFAETLRYYPVVPYLDRECDIGGENGKSTYSLEPHSSFKIPNGMPIIIPICAIHHDPNYFPNPSVFDPERFSSENKNNIIPGTYLPFGMGPRRCIAEYLGLVQSKVGLINVLKNHYVRPSVNTPKILKFSKKTFSLTAENGINLEVYRE